MATAVDSTHPTEMHSCYKLFSKNYLMINYQTTRNLVGHPDLQSWVPDWATAKKFLNHRLGCIPPTCPPYMLQYPSTRSLHQWGGASSNEQIWTGLWPWPPDVTRGWGSSSEQVRTGFQSLSPGYEGSLCVEVQCMSNGYMGPPLPRPQTDIRENITFPQLRPRKVKIPLGAAKWLTMSLLWVKNWL